MKYFMLMPMLLSVSLLSFANDLSLSSKSNQYSLKPIVADVGIPWAIQQLPSNNLLVTQRKGKLWLVNPGSGKKQIISGLPPIDDGGQGGLLDVILDPNFNENQFIYFTYSKQHAKHDYRNTVLARAKLSKDEVSLSQVTTLYKAQSKSATGRHFGSRIAFDQQGFLYFSIGDRGKRDEYPQDLTSDNGKIYRLSTSGSVPNDNPFVNTPHVVKAIYSYGHRNPQGLYFDKQSNTLWSHEHGPRGGDELNIISEGLNYGWPKVTFGRNYIGTIISDKTHLDGMTPPVLHWTPSIAPSGLTKVTSKQYPYLQNKLLVGSLKFSYIVVIDVSNVKEPQQEYILPDSGRVRSLHQGVDGKIYVGIDGKGIFEITSKAANQK